MPRDTNPHDTAEQTRTVPRRRVLQAAGVGLAATGLASVGTVDAGSPTVYDGPYQTTVEAHTVAPRDLGNGGGGSGGSGSGDGKEHVVPRRSPKSSGTPNANPGTAQTSAPTGSLVSTDFDGLDATDVRGVVPPDSQLAANGAGDVVEAINSQVAFFDETGTRAFETTLDAFYASAAPYIDDSDPGAAFFQSDGYIIFDPRARFDPDSGRFLLACALLNFRSDGSVGEGGMLLAVSSASDPMDPWYTYYVRPAGADGTFGAGLVDYPELGVDDAAVYLTENFFPSAFSQATLAAVPKAAATAGDDLTVNHFTDLRNPDGSVAFTVQPADGGGYFANCRYFQGQTLTQWTVADPVAADASLTNTAVRVAPYTNPTQGAEQPNTSKQIDMGDDRILRVNYDGRSLWTAHTIDDGRVRWYELDPAGGVRQSSEFRLHGEATFYPSIASDGSNAVFVYNNSSPRGDGAGFVDVGVAAIGDGEVAGYETVKNGENGYSYTTSDGTSVLRWGDYSGIAPDPGGGFWVVGEYAKRIDGRVDSYYGTRIAKIEP